MLGACLTVADQLLDDAEISGNEFGLATSGRRFPQCDLRYPHRFVHATLERSETAHVGRGGPEEGFCGEQEVSERRGWVERNVTGLLRW